MPGSNFFSADAIDKYGNEIGLTDEAGNALWAKGTTVPADADVGYAKGCLFIDTDASAGSIAWLNEGTAASSAFHAFDLGAVAPSEITLTDAHVLVGNASNIATDVAMSGDVTIANTGAATIADNAVTGAKIADTGVAPGKIALTDAHILIGVAGAASDIAMTGDATIDNAGALTIGAGVVDSGKIAAGGVALSNLATGIAMSHIVVFAGEVTWSGGAATLATTVTGLVGATDLVIASIKSAPTESAYLAAAAGTDNTITFTLSTANTSNDAVITYQVLRAAA